MIRDTRGNKSYWDEWIDFDIVDKRESFAALDLPSLNPSYDPQYCFDIVGRHIKLLMRKYSRGDSVLELAENFTRLLNAWEMSNKLAEEICAQNDVKKCRDWTFDLADLNHYIWCFWLIGLALLLDIPEKSWRRLRVLVDGAGRDELVDRVIAVRQPGRPTGEKLLHPQPYARLLKAINAPKEEQAHLLKEFVDHWYVELDRPKKRGPIRSTSDPTGTAMASKISRAAAISDAGASRVLCARRCLKWTTLFA